MRKHFINRFRNVEFIGCALLSWHRVLAAGVILIASLGLASCTNTQNELVEIIKRCPLIYVCEININGDFIVVDLLRNEVGLPFVVKMSDIPPLNYPKMGPKKVPGNMRLVVFVQHDAALQKSGIISGQSEMPLTPEGKLTLDGTRLSELLQMIRENPWPKGERPSERGRD